MLIITALLPLRFLSKSYVINSSSSFLFVCRSVCPLKMYHVEITEWNEMKPNIFWNGLTFRIHFISAKGSWGRGEILQSERLIMFLCDLIQLDFCRVFRINRVCFYWVKTKWGGKVIITMVGIRRCISL